MEPVDHIDGARGINASQGSTDDLGKGKWIRARAWKITGSMILLIFAYYVTWLLVETVEHDIILVPLLLFMSLLLLSPFFRMKKKKRIYSRCFSQAKNEGDRDTTVARENGKRILNVGKYIKIHKHGKPLLKKCPNCRLTIMQKASWCPACGYSMK
ncbi:hypothetical protein GF325_17030 [Candidatus Bathyarchaeota archaeon]|nr:hypothetical protein [Candidatus Bathyarchaeota archaeon]